MSPTNCRCVPCDFNCNAGKWDLDGKARDCYGCDGSGFADKCSACFGPECTASEVRTKDPKRDGNGLVFCFKCFEYLLEEVSDVE